MAHVTLHGYGNFFRATSGGSSRAVQVGADAKLRNGILALQRTTGGRTCQGSTGLGTCRAAAAALQRNVQIRGQDENGRQRFQSLPLIGRLIRLLSERLFIEE